ncbi:Transglycosylase SLT domain-containing protein [Cladophialophora immunda]|nr:Transglycosylase SLT domain-containing protein [Cladophialophora immunda]
MSGSGAPIDPHYYDQHGPASSFAPFDDHICAYEDLWHAFEPTIQEANEQHEDGNDYSTLIDQAIQHVSQSTGVESYLLLCIIMQESTGNLFVQTTYDADHEPTGGLMQCSGCEGLDTSDAEPNLDDVISMVETGATHLQQCLQQQNGNVYEALRIYNSGSIAESGDLCDPASVGTPDYVCDVANRTHGWISGNGKPS